MALRYVSTASYYNGGTGSVDKGDAAFRNIVDGVLDITDEAGTWIDWLEQTGKFVSTTDEDFYVYTNDWLFSTFTVGGGTGNGISSVAAGNTGTLTLDSAANAAKLRRGDVLQDPATGAQVMVASVSGANVVVAVASDAAAAVTIADDAVLINPFNLIPEGSYAGDDPEVDLQRKTNRINVIESATSVTDFRTAAKYVIDLGNGEKGVIYKDQHDLFTKHRGKEAFALLTGQYLTFDAADTGFSKDVKGSRGLDSYINDYGGISHTASAADTTNNGLISTANFDELDFANFSRKLDKNRAPKEGDLMCGGDFGVNFDSVFREHIKNSGWDPTKVGKGSATGKAIDMGIDVVHIFDRTYRKMRSPLLDHQYVTSATTSSTYAKSAYFIPGGKIKAGGKSVDRIRVRYLDVAGAFSGGRILEKHLGGLLEKPTERTNKMEWAYTSWIGLEVNGTQHFAKFIGV